MQDAVEPGMLQPASQRMTFLYTEHAVVNRESNAITITDSRGAVHVPAAAISVVLLGPGTRITQQAVVLLAASATSICWVGEAGVRFYASGIPHARSTHLLERQAWLVSHRRMRLEVARKMYEVRWPGENVSRMTMQQLRGREGARVRAAYRINAEQWGVRWSGRRYSRDDWDAGDPVNQALSAANSCLYGVVHAVVVALGCSPDLGFIHTGHARSFVHDLADLYKADLTVPIAFEVAANGEHNVGTRARHLTRDRMHESKLLSRIVRDLQFLLGVETPAEALEVDSLELWDEDVGRVVGGVNYGDES